MVNAEIQPGSKSREQADLPTAPSALNCLPTLPSACTASPALAAALWAAHSMTSLSAVFKDVKCSILLDEASCFNCQAALSTI